MTRNTLLPWFALKSLTVRFSAPSDGLPAVPALAVAVPVPISALLHLLGIVVLPSMSLFLQGDGKAAPLLRNCLAKKTSVSLMPSGCVPFGPWTLSVAL